MSLTTYLLTAIASLPVFHEDNGAALANKKHDQAQLIASAIEKAVEDTRGWPSSRRELAALLLTVAYHETRLSLRIHDGHCKPNECDNGRARGLWQLHAHRSLPHDRWLNVAGLTEEATVNAAREAATALVRSRRMCVVATRGGDWLQATLTAYAGAGCGGRFPDLKARVRTYRKLLGIKVEPGAA